MRHVVSVGDRECVNLDFPKSSTVLVYAACVLFFRTTARPDSSMYSFSYITSYVSLQSGHKQSDFDYLLLCLTIYEVKKTK